MKYLTLIFSLLLLVSCKKDNTVRGRVYNPVNNKDISAKTPFGDYNILANVLADYQSGETIELKPGSHVQQGASAHFYISRMCYWSGGGGAKSMESTNTNNSNYETTNNWSTTNRKEEWNLYPNPSNDRISIKSKFVQEGDMLYLYSMMGKLLGKVTLDENNSAPIKKLIGNHRLVLVQWHSNGTLKGTRKLIIQ